MTPTQVKKLLSPESFECQKCKKIYATAFEVVKCIAIHEVHQRSLVEKKKEKAEKEKQAAEALKKVLEDNL